MPNQFKAAEVNGVPFAVVLGEEEVAQGKVKVKEMGLREGHPEKEGVLVNTSDLVEEIQTRLARKAELDNMILSADGLRVVGGVRGEKQEPSEPMTSELDVPKEEAAEKKDETTAEKIAAVPAS